MIKQRFIDLSCSGFNHIIRVNNKAHESLSYSDEIKLLRPQIDRIVIQDVKERIVLHCHDRKLDDFANEIGHDRAAATAHWFQMRDVGNGHVVGKFENVIPILSAIHRAGAKTSGAVPVHVAVDFCCSACKFVALSV